MTDELIQAEGSFWLPWDFLRAGKFAAEQMMVKKTRNFFKQITEEMD